jgi:hypothetical protein
MAHPRPIVLAFLGVALVAAACSRSTEGPETRELELGPEVTRLAVAGGVEAEVTLGARSPLVTVTGPGDALDDVGLTVEGDTLRITYDGGDEASARLRATVALAALERIAVAAASTVDVVGSGSEALGVGVSGSSALTLTGVTLRFLTLAIDGGSRVAAEGTTSSLEASLNGASTATLDRLAATDAVLELRGASAATVAVSSTLEVTASGASSVRYATPPAQLTEYTSGGSSVGPMGA